MSRKHVIEIYRYEGGWAFDDPRHGLVAEALIRGADTLVNKMLCLVAAGQTVNRARLTFAAGPAPGLRFFIRKTGETDGGTTYLVVDPPLVGHQLWLCPALLCYFDVAPAAISLDIRPVVYESEEESAE